MLCPAVGTKVIQLQTSQLDLGCRGVDWASSAVSYHGPGQSSIAPHQGVNGVAGLLG